MNRQLGWMAAGVAAVSGSLFPLAPTARAAGEVLEHSVRSGDNLHLIAGYYYKDPRQWKKIYKTNRKTIRSADLLVPGKVLRVEVEPGQMWDIPYEEFVSRARRQSR